MKMAPVIETKKITLNLYIDLDEKGDLVSMTIEQAKKRANISEVSIHGAYKKDRGSSLDQII